jgi:ribonucleoside-triphosphate reductase
MLLNSVIKRDGRIVEFDLDKILLAIEKACKEVDGEDYDKQLVIDVAYDVADRIKEENGSVDVESIQNMVEDSLMSSDRKDVARAYVRYRYKKEIMRENNSTYEGILQLVNLQNEELKEENSNKNAVIASTQRDYMAGEVSKDLSHRFLLPKDVVEAHDAGIIHFHDMDYFAQKIINCALVNLDDMLQNGTVINKTLIEKPKSFSTACTIATQIMAVFASEQFGGQSVSLTSLAKFVDVSRQKIRKQVQNEIRISNGDMNKLEEITEQRVKDEIKRGVQIIQYQINTLNTSNGQTPFVSLFMYLGEAEDEQTKHDLALMIEEVLNQRIQGTKNEKGVWVTPAFPKLFYLLEEDNIHENSPYWYLTKLAAKCVAKRMVPDFISEKIMKQYKVDENGNGQCYPCINKTCA